MWVRAVGLNGTRGEKSCSGVTGGGRPLFSSSVALRLPSDSRGVLEKSRFETSGTSDLPLFCSGLALLCW